MRSAVVLGAGTMGSQIAAHLANAGVPSLLLDLTPEVAREGFERARKLKPDPFFTPEAAALVSTGGFDQDLARVAGCDWIIEAVVEREDVKQDLLARVERHWRQATIVSSNTSGIPLAALAKGRSGAFRRHWLGTHFFNPPRYLRLLEVVPTPDTDPAVVERVSRFADRRLGKGVVIAKDSPNFIANRIGLYGVMRILEALASGRFTIEEIDAMTGPAVGRPKSATFRTMDIAGIDVLAHVAANLAERLDRDADRSAFVLPGFVPEMVRRGWVGEKAGRGFYMKQSGAERSEILTLDPCTMEYRPKRSARLAALEQAQTIQDPRQRIRSLFLSKDRVGEFMRDTLGATLVYTARVAREVAHSIDDIDRAMRWGFAWDRGPFELWDSIGLRDVLEATHTTEVPPIVDEVLARGENAFRTGDVPPAAPDLQILRSAKERERVVKKNPGASLVDLGDGVLAVEFHSKMNAIGADTVQMLQAGVKEASRNFQALVVGNDAPDFSAGANLMLLLLEAQEGNWEDIDLMIREFQRAMMGLRYADVPVVVAPGGRTLGGGCEVVLHGTEVQAAAETYIGLVEVGVGLIPAGGGTKEMVVRNTEHLPSPNVDLLPWAQRAFETIGFAKVSTSGPEAKRIGYLRSSDGITMNRERLLTDAKARALALARAGHQCPVRRAAIPVGGEPVLAALKLGIHLAWRAGRISEYDAHVGRKLANIIAGGALPHPARVTEPYLLDLEREAFLSLCGERKTHERIQYTLKTGQPLRN
ncbi:MAG: enoyl-CoA hydratase/isomerase family protein [Acidobacteria bacterium]|nr:enoyl-CoA hydratase/isomerase family protein [Acidobacteriota bacterium]